MRCNVVPNNPIKTVEELLTYVGKTVYHVYQSGGMSKFVFRDIVSFDDLSSGGMPSISQEKNYYRGYSVRRKGSYTGHLGDVNILGHCNEHYLFGNKEDAEAYSNGLMNDVVYMESVRRYHNDISFYWDYENDEA
jgi:hypothetical protein